MASLGRPGPAPRAAMPAWKREILERRRAKLAALGAGPGPGAASAGSAERLVLADSLGPLRENPFIRLESERRRGARPAPPLLELYRRVPGVRAIRADGILIIESAPGFAPAAPPAAGLRAAEVVVYEAPPPGRVSRLLEKFDPPAAPRRRGSPEGARPAPPPPPLPAAPPPPLPLPEPPAGPRAPLRRPARAAPPGPPGSPAGPVPSAGSAGSGADAGDRRKDFLQKTGSNSFTVHPRGLPRGPGRPLLNGPAAPEPHAGPANGLAHSQPAPGEWKPKAVSGEPPLPPPPSPGTPSATPAASPSVPAPSPVSATPSQRQWVSAATSANDSFEIRLAPKPDLETIPPGDVQARALASLRVNSRNSFLFIPKRRAAGNPPPGGRQTAELPKGEVGRASQRQKLGDQLASGVDGAPAPERGLSVVQGPWTVREGGCPKPAIALTDGAVERQRPSSPPLLLPATCETEPGEGLGVSSLAKYSRESGRPGLPVTFIDEVDSEEEEVPPQEAKLPCSGLTPQHHLHPTRPGHPSEFQHRGNNTFTVVPKRKPGTFQEPHFSQANGESQPREAEAEEAAGLLGSHAALESTLKKRYPTVHEIEVIGGYLALQKSCLTKAGSSRKKMKISFNDKSLHTTFEYPSESSLVQEEEAEEEEEEAEEEEEEEEGPGSEKPFSLFLPRATFVSSVGPESPQLPDGSSGLSCYTPKHSMAFSKWQEQTLVQVPSETEPPLKEAMLTPASQNDLSDFRSEPALYF
ncbi:taperin [Perognathus longimembris pacificus]|uniref:LOW QUALITY PROTEIN: taperin-like n=1 Tax=Perognathus longimembris pacificus TaxID=214514 RepID=UPI002019721C|nr:LOW QUALITY PROTEIN: taperin-like [Perognathus longimembris pacificus]XP_048202548.1 taperin [Perognathus longimembris pacificus]